MGISVTIRNLPNRTRDVFAERAAASGRSLQEYLSAELQRLADQPSPEDWLAGANEFAQAHSLSQKDQVLADLEADRR